jgi:hypothetical protein
MNYPEINLQDGLLEMSRIGDFDFSYNAELIPGDSILAMQYEKEKVKAILKHSLPMGTGWQVISNYIILLPPKREVELASDKKINYKISGIIIDRSTGEIIKNATVYDIQGKRTIITNSEGHFSLALDKSEMNRTLSLSRNGYFDTIIMVQPLQDHQLEISLKPKDQGITSVQSIQANRLAELQKRKVVHLMVPEDALVNAQNLNLPVAKLGQVSFLPFLGSNRSYSGAVTNRFSLNVLAGYSGGVKGFEVGGLTNIVRRDVEGVQVGGLGNVVGNKTKGTQIGGFFNVNQGTFTGIQVAGFSNIVGDTLSGIQIAGFHNMLRGAMNGIQVSGFNNITTQDVDGMQVTGFANIALKDVKLAQVAGFLNYADNVGGFQGAGFANIANGEVNASQLAGFMNYASGVTGLQAAGFANISSEHNTGVQLAGFINISKKVRGFQLATINISDTVESGIPIGIISIVRKGYHPIEVSVDERLYTKVSLKTGVRAFYNIFAFSFHPDFGYQFAYGLGSNMGLSKRSSLSLDLTSSTQMDKDYNIDFDIYNTSRLNLTYDVKLHKFITLFAGPSINMVIRDKDASDPYGINKELFIGTDLSSDNTTIKLWYGGSFGIRF